MFTKERAPIHERATALPLNIRCDRCGAHGRASVVVTVDGHESALVLCMHHYGESEDKIAEQATYVILYPLAPETTS